MPDQLQAPPAPDAGQNSVVPPAAPGPAPVPPAGVQFTPEQQQHLGVLIAEERRKERERAQVEAQAAADKAKKDAETAALTEQGKYKELADQLQQKLTAAEATAATAARAALCATIAAELGLPPALAGRLQGADEAAIRADGAELAKLVARPVSTGSAGNGARPDPTAPTGKVDLTKPPGWGDIFAAGRTGA